jgi:DNA polymerase elongation subunit (family B)
LLIDTQYISSTNKLVCSYVNNAGQIKLKYFDFPTPLKYVTCAHDDPTRHPTYKSWDGKPVKQIENNRPDRYAIYEFLDQQDEKTKSELFDFAVPKIYFVDIETEIVDGFPEAETALTRVLSISVVYDDKIILLGLEDMPQDMQDRIREKTNKYFEKDGVEYSLKYVKYEEEFDMLYTFFKDMVPQMPLITGWNFLKYDWMYLVNRSRKLTKMVNGQMITIDPRQSSQTKYLKKLWGTEVEVPVHRMIFDYMQLYEVADTSIKVKESSSLDFVSSKLVGVPKIKYNGSLQKLYEDDFETFMYYNAVDSVLVQKIHESKNYVSIIFAISALAKIKITDVVSQMNNALASLAITEGVLRSRFREMENVVLFKDEGFSSQSAKGIAGGWVRDPVVGMNKWVSTYDFASLYPTTQLQFYIAPETFLGVQGEDKDYCFRNGKRIRIDKTKHVVCNNGCVFEKRISPTLKMLEDVYADRKKNKKIMMQKREEWTTVMHEIEKLEKEL